MECVFPENIHNFPIDHRISVGRGIKMPKIPKGHERLAIIIYVQCTYVLLLL